MANIPIKFKSGLSTQLPSIEAGSVLFTIDTHEAYIDVDNSTRFKISDQNKADKATTLADYGIEDAYTKEEIGLAFGKIKNMLDSIIDVSDETLSKNHPKDENTAEG